MREAWRGIRGTIRYMVPRPSRLAHAAIAALLVAGVVATGGAARQDDLAPQHAGPRIVAIGDIHGAYQPLTSLLRETGLLDDQGRWAGGTTTLVQTGDYTDRGAAIRPVMDLLMTLERQAAAAGGRVIVLLGNHETMNLTRLLQDTSPAAIASFADDRSETRRANAYAQYVKWAQSRRRALGRDGPEVQTEEAWMQAHPPGLIEYLEAFGPDGTYGRWLREKEVAVEVEGTVFLHGGLNPDHAASRLSDVNKRVREEIARFDAHARRLVDRDVILPFFTFYEILATARADLEAWIARQGTSSPFVSPTIGADRQYAEMLVDLLEIGDWSIIHEDGPVWFRGFASWTGDEAAPRLEQLQKRYKAKRFVVGHTVPAIHRILPRFDDRVFLIDTGMLSDVYLGGQPSALEIVGDEVTAIYLGSRVPLVPGPPDP